MLENHSKEVVNNFFAIFAIVSSFFCAVYLLGGDDKYNTPLISMLPLGYALCFFILFITSRKNIGLFHYILLGIGFLRYVVHPFISEYLGGYVGRSNTPPDPASFDLAVIIMLIELVAVSFAIIIFEKIHNKKVGKTNVVESKLKFLGVKVTFFLLLLSFVLLFFHPKALLMVHFIKPVLNELESIELGTLEIFSGYFFIISKQLFFINVLYFLSNKYREGRKQYLFFGAIFFFFNVAIYFGTNRTDLLINALVSYIFFVKYFGKQAHKMAVLVLPLTLLLLSIITSARNYEKSAGEEYLHTSNDYIQTYFGGVYNVAIGIEIETYYPEASNPEILVFDILRPMLGVNVLVRNWDLKYSNIYFNDRLWRHVDRRSQILPMVSQSFLYFGIYGCWLLSVSFLALYYFLRRYEKSSENHEEIKYFLTLSLIRLGFLFGQNTMNLINDLSMNLFLVLLIVFLFKKKNFTVN